METGFDCPYVRFGYVRNFTQAEILILEQNQSFSLQCGQAQYSLLDNFAQLVIQNATQRFLLCRNPRFFRQLIETAFARRAAKILHRQISRGCEQIRFQRCTVGLKILGTSNQAQKTIVSHILRGFD
jgi:hypothetical protein